MTKTLKAKANGIRVTVENRPRDEIGLVFEDLAYVTLTKLEARELAGMLIDAVQDS